jgi:anaerobic dimethyl sulfoxide reductase subunit A
MYARTKPAALKASWGPGAQRLLQYNAWHAVQAMTGNIGILAAAPKAPGKGWHAESTAYPYDENANLWWASIKSDRWAHCVLNYPNVKREEIGCWPRDDELDGKIPNIKAIFWHGSDWFNQLTNINGNRGHQKAGTGGVLRFDHYAVRADVVLPPTRDALS